MEKTHLQPLTNCPSKRRITPHQAPLLIGDQLLETEEKKEVFSPFALWEKDQPTRLSLGHINLASAQQASEALKWAQKAWQEGRGHWAGLPFSERLEAGRRFLKSFSQKREAVAPYLMWEISKTWKDSLAEFDRTVIYLEETLRLMEENYERENQFQIGSWGFAQIRRAPRGICLLVGPFNYPLNETFSILWPGLLLGNSFILKQPRWGSLSWSPFLEDLQKCFPPGSIQILQGKGSDLLPPLLQTGKVQNLSFVGSSSTASQLVAYHPFPLQLHRLFGLDAKNAAIIGPQMDEKHFEDILKGALSFNGQRCTALKILYAPEAQKGKVEQTLQELFQNVSCQYPWENKAFVTPLADPEGPDKWENWLEDAELQGAKILVRGEKKIGNFLNPSLISQVKPGMKLFDEEQFGPVLPIRFYQTLEEVYQDLSHSSFGMQMSLFSSSPSWICEALNAFSGSVCRMNVNALSQRSPDHFPFSGRKASAVGSLGLKEVLRELSVDQITLFSEKSLAAESLKEGGSKSFHLGFTFSEKIQKS